MQSKSNVLARAPKGRPSQNVGFGLSNILNKSFVQHHASRSVTYVCICHVQYRFKFRTPRPAPHTVTVTRDQELEHFLLFVIYTCQQNLIAAAAPAHQFDYHSAESDIILPSLTRLLSAQTDKIIHESSSNSGAGHRILP